MSQVDDRPFGRQMEAMDEPEPTSPRRQFWRLMIIVATVAVVGVAVALWWLITRGGNISIHTIIAAALGVGLSVLLAGVLMGLVFLSSRSGHDDRIASTDDEE